MEHNIITLTDSYKPTHWTQYPPGIQKVFSYFESRVGAKWDTTVFFGLQVFIKEYLEGVVVTREKIAEAKDLLDRHLGPGFFNEAGWKKIVDKYGGMLPVTIRAVPEGTPVPVSNVMMTVENNDPELYWLTNYLETLLVEVWYPCTVATQSREMKKIIRGYLEKTGDPDLIDFKLHDFGFRGVTCPENAGLGGMAHLVNFKGTDTLRGIEYAQKFYKATEMPGFSIPASEHSTMTSWGREREVDAYRNMLRAYPKGLVACVSDSWNIREACAKIWGGVLRDEVLQREGTLVIRPDSGDPITLLPELLGILYDRFGGEVNHKGYRVLDPHVRMIQGDGITYESLSAILEAVTKAGFSADNLAFGSGGGLLQKLDRDTQRIAFKCSAAKINGEWTHVHKAPASDPTKNSKRGRLTLIQRGKTMETVAESFDPKFEDGVEVLDTVFQNGMLMKETTFDSVRLRARI